MYDLLNIIDCLTPIVIAIIASVTLVKVFNK